MMFCLKAQAAGGLRRTAAAALVLVLAGVCAGPAIAAGSISLGAARPLQQGFEPGSPVQVAEDAGFTISGTVTAVDYDANVIVVSTHGTSVKILVTPSTSIEIHGESGSMSDIRRGSRLTVSGVVRNDTHVAETIVIK
jgi:hypothetical protein